MAAENTGNIFLGAVPEADVTGVRGKALIVATGAGDVRLRVAAGAAGDNHTLQLGAGTALGTAPKATATGCLFLGNARGTDKGVADEVALATGGGSHRLFAAKTSRNTALGIGACAGIVSPAPGTLTLLRHTVVGVLAPPSDVNPNDSAETTHYTDAVLLSAGAGLAYYADQRRCWFGIAASASVFPTQFPSLRGDRTDGDQPAGGAYALWIGRPAATPVLPVTDRRPTAICDPGLGHCRWHCDDRGRTAWSLPDALHVPGDAADEAAIPAADDTAALTLDDVALQAPAASTSLLTLTWRAETWRCPLGPAWSAVAAAAVRRLNAGPTSWAVVTASTVAIDATDPDNVTVKYWSEERSPADDMVAGGGLPARPYNAFVVPVNQTVGYGRTPVISHDSLRLSNATGCLVFPHSDFSANALARADGRNGGRVAPPQLAQCTVFCAICPTGPIEPVAAGETVMTLLSKGTTALQLVAVRATVDDPADLYPQLTTESRPLDGAANTDDGSKRTYTLRGAAARPEAGFMVVAYRIGWNNLSVFVSDRYETVNGGFHAHHADAARPPLFRPTPACPDTATDLVPPVEYELADADRHPLCLGARLLDDAAALTAPSVVEHFNGYVCEVRFYPCVLPQEDVGVVIQDMIDRNTAVLGLSNLTDALGDAVTGNVVLGSTVGKNPDSLGPRNTLVGPAAGLSLSPAATDNTICGAFQCASATGAVGHVVLAPGTGGTTDAASNVAALAAIPADGATWCGPAAHRLFDADTAARANTTWIGGASAADVAALHAGTVVVADGAGSGAALAANPAVGSVWVGPGCKRLFSQTTANDPPPSNTVWLGSTLVGDIPADYHDSVVVADGAGNAVFSAQPASGNAWFGPNARRLFGAGV